VCPGYVGHRCRVGQKQIAMVPASVVPTLAQKNAQEWGTLGWAMQTKTKEIL